MRYDLDSLIVLLGAPNDVDGGLSTIARSRIDLAVMLRRKRPTTPILPTGGFGEHFNTSPLAHHVHATAALVRQGVPSASVLPGVNSTNTYEDAALSCEFARTHGFTSLAVVTSDFHAERATLLFTRFAAGLSVEIVPAASSELSPRELTALRAHERAAIAKLPTR
jgi:uncharacterized SAM-binding protein YcdF (DUF218 family)